MDAACVCSLKIMTRKLCIPLLAAVTLLAATSSASAATTIGAALTGTPTLHPANCAVVSGGVPVSCTVYISSIVDQAEMAPGGIFSPADGVITRWRVVLGASTASSIAITPRVLGFTNKYTALRSGAAQSLPVAGGSFEFPTRLPISANSLFAIDAVTNGAVGDAPKFVTNIATNAGLIAKTPAVPDGGTFGIALGGGATTTKLMINADIEPDADKDGFGDETQDLCTSSATAQGACPAPVITAPKSVKGGFSFTSDLPGKATTTLYKVTGGRKVGKKCKSKAKKGKKCKIYKKFAQWGDDVVAGANTISYSYKVGGKSLKKGSYRATIVIVTAQLTVTTTNIDFKIKK